MRFSSFGTTLGITMATLFLNCAEHSAPPAGPPQNTGAASNTAPAGPSQNAGAASNTAAPEHVGIRQRPFGTVDGKEVTLFTLTNANGLVMKVMNYGAIVTEFHVPDRHGKLADIVAGYEDLDGYLKSSPYFGATVGRVAGRIKNGTFQLDGKRYTLAINDPPNHLHGGKKGWDKVVWDAEPTETPAGPAIRFSYVSKDGDEGYPGTVHARVTYALTKDNEFSVDIEATSDADTPINIVHHAYWNLGGYDSGPIGDEELTLNADAYTPGDPVVPNGVVTPVKGTPFDFTTAKPIGKDLLSVVVPGRPIGYDHNFLVNGDPHTLRRVARVKDPKSGRVMTLDANEPGVQFYAGVFLDGTLKGKGHVYKQYEAFCLETQKVPNAINVPAWKDDVVLKPGQTYKHLMIHRFSAE